MAVTGNQDFFCTIRVRNRKQVCMSHQLQRLFKHDILLIALVSYFLATRTSVILQRLVPFQFDHGKDEIAVLHMFLTTTPKLIGPWTSIPGLFFGPAWYYLLLPGTILFQADPIAPVLTMVLLGVITISYVYYTFGKIEAIILTASSVFYTVTSSAWNPFPMVFLSFIILGQLKSLESKHQLLVRTACLLGLAAGFGFHFSTAFAIFFPLLIALSIIFKKIKVSIKSLLTLILSFCAPFLPQLLFEIRHNFLETKAVLTYLHTGDTNPASFEKLKEILFSLLGEIKEVLAPSGYWVLTNFNTAFQLVFLVIIIVGIYFFQHSQQNRRGYLLLDASLWFSLPILAFTYFHFNVWYLLPLFSFTIIILGQIVRALPQSLKLIFLSLYLVMSISKLAFFLIEDGPQLLQTTSFLTVKESAINYIYQQAGEKSFASYQFMPDIYDYPYQYLYFTHALRGERLPTEFSYQPNEISYIPEKLDLLNFFVNQADNRQPELIFYIIEGQRESSLYDQWWSRQQHGELLQEQAISANLTVITALPEPTK